MARISSYVFDANVTDKDAWIGTEAGNRQTKQFTAEAVANYLNIKGKISISAQMVFKLVGIPSPAPGEFSGPADGSAIAPTVTIDVSTIDAGGANTVAFLTYIVGNNILISEQNDIDKFGHFTIVSYTNKVAGVYTLVLTPIAGNGTFDVNKFYDFAVFTLTSQGTPTFIFNQANPATTWDITHNLGKFPSITVIDTGNTVVFGEYNYVSNNRVLLTFSAAFDGKAYLN